LLAAQADGVTLAGVSAFGFKVEHPAVEPAKLKAVAFGGVAATGGVPIVQPNAFRVRVVAVLLATTPV
jgi:hypothetical protein